MSTTILHCNALSVKQIYHPLYCTYLFHHAVLRDYCLVDEFIAECPTGSIIMMEEAQYGRMQLGTCLKRDFGYMDCSRYEFTVLYFMLTIRMLHTTWVCSVLQRLGSCLSLYSDVMQIMDRFCSGKRTCRVRVVQLEDFTSPCPDMFSYLQARYTCLEGGWACSAYTSIPIFLCLSE